MKTIHTFALAAAICGAALSYGQQTTTNSNNNNPLSPTGRSSSIHDNPGILGHQFSDVSFGWTDFKNSSTEGYDAAFSANVPIAAGFDAGLGYNYYWEAKHRDPLTRASWNDRHHTLAAYGKYYMPMQGVKPFVGGGAGYQWHRGDLQSFRTYDHEWVWSAMGGVEIPFGRFAVTPQVVYDDNMRGGSIGTWSYGAQVHHWFSERMGGYLDASYHDPHGPGTEMWSYFAGLRYRF
jgi:hypothetical protein